MRKTLFPVLIALLIAAIAFLGSYSMGLLDRDNVYQAIDTEYGSGAFTYSGGMKDGLFSGNGTIYLKDGGVFTGNFKEGRFSGEGIYYSEESAQVSGWYFEGVFQDGRPISGVFYYPDGTKLTWEGAQK